MLSIVDILRHNGYTGRVVIDSKDTDVYAESALAASQNDGDLLIKRGGDMVDCSKLVSSDMTECVVPLHIFTGNDGASSFYGHGKSKLYEKVENSPRAQEQIQHLGEDESLEEECVQKLLAFTREVIYGDFHSKSMNQARTKKWRKQKNKSFCRLPPDEDSLRQHIR